MNIQIDKIIGQNDFDNERLVIGVNSDTDIGRYGIFKTGKNSDGGITNKLLDSYWFPDKQVKAGDLVVLYTKSGISSEIKNDDGSTSHFFYWGRTSIAWDQTSGCVVVSIPEWQVFKE